MKRIVSAVIMTGSAALFSISTVEDVSASTSIDTNAWYRLSTYWKGRCESLDVINDGINNNLHLVKSGNFSGQLWKLTPTSDGHFQLSTMWLGANKVLEVKSDGNTVQLNAKAKTRWYSKPYNQYWDITPESIDSTYRITNVWRGPAYSLDIINDTINNSLPTLASSGYYSGQFWRLTKADFVTPPPIEMQLDPFYKKYLNADGIPIVSSDLTPDDALYRVQFLTLNMMARMPQVRDEMIRHNIKIAVMADTEVTTDIPEHSFLPPSWDQRARGLGATLQVPTSSCAEENLLCYTQDPYTKEDIFVHEFAHSIANLGLAPLYPFFQSELQAAYDNAIATGLWENTYAITNIEEYFAEGVQDWFNVNAQSEVPNSIHNFVNTREELKDYDPLLYSLISKWFVWDDGNCSCHEPE